MRFLADKVSGIEGTIFGLSIVLDVAAACNARNRFKFPFYGLSVHADVSQSDEWIDSQAYSAVCDDVIRFMREEGLGYFEDVRRMILEESESLLRDAKVVTGDMARLSDFDLAQSYRLFMGRYVDAYGLGAMTFLYESGLSERLHASLGRYDHAAEVMQRLLGNSYRSFMIENEDRLLEIRRADTDEEQSSLISRYLEDFFFMKSSYTDGPVIDREMVIRMAEEVVAHEDGAAAPEHPIPDDLSDEERDILALFRETEIIRDQRKKVCLIGNYVMFRFLYEACRRGGIPPSIGKRAFWFELCDCVYHPRRLAEKLETRHEATMVHDDRNSFYLQYSAIESRNQVSTDIREFKGTPASRGCVRGRVRVILGQGDFTKFQTGEILVATMTRPEFVSVMKQSVAIITDEGGLTSHAAIVARELRKPCIIGTKVATQILHDGDLVEVDADHGVVRRVEQSTKNIP